MASLAKKSWCGVSMGWGGVGLFGVGSCMYKGTEGSVGICGHVMLFEMAEVQGMSARGEAGELGRGQSQESSVA